jgi:hypothetical protein
VKYTQPREEILRNSTEEIQHFFFLEIQHFFFLEIQHILKVKYTQPREEILRNSTYPQSEIYTTKKGKKILKNKKIS